MEECKNLVLTNESQSDRLEHQEFMNHGGTFPGMETWGVSASGLTQYIGERQMYLQSNLLMHIWNAVSKEMIQLSVETGRL